MRRRNRSRDEQSADSIKLNLDENIHLIRGDFEKVIYEDPNGSNNILPNSETTEVFKINRSRRSSIGSRTGILRGIRTKESLLGQQTIVQIPIDINIDSHQSENSVSSNNSLPSPIQHTLPTLAPNPEIKPNEITPPFENKEMPQNQIDKQIKTEQPPLSKTAQNCSPTVDSLQENQSESLATPSCFQPPTTYPNQQQEEVYQPKEESHIVNEPMKIIQTTPDEIVSTKSEILQTDNISNQPDKNDDNINENIESRSYSKLTTGTISGHNFEAYPGSHANEDAPILPNSPPLPIIQDTIVNFEQPKGEKNQIVVEDIKQSPLASQETNEIAFKEIESPSTNYAATNEEIHNIPESNIQPPEIFINTEEIINNLANELNNIDIDANNSPKQQEGPVKVTSEEDSSTPYKFTSNENLASDNHSYASPSIPLEPLSLDIPFHENITNHSTPQQINEPEYQNQGLQATEKLESNKIPSPENVLKIHSNTNSMRAPNYYAENNTSPVHTSHQGEVNMNLNNASNYNDLESVKHNVNQITAPNTFHLEETNQNIKYNNNYPVENNSQIYQQNMIPNGSGSIQNNAAMNTLSGNENVASIDTNKIYSSEFSAAYALWQQEYARWYKQILEYQNNEYSYSSRSLAKVADYYPESNINDSASFVSRASVVTDRNEYISRPKDRSSQSNALSKNAVQTVPYLYTNCHPRCTFGPCNRISVCNLKDNSVHIFSTELSHVSTDKNFPGPLSSSDTCVRLMSTYIQNIARSLAEGELKLLWNLLLLLTKTKKYTTQDICDLLLNFNTDFKPSKSLMSTKPGLPMSVHSIICQSLICDDLKSAIYHCVQNQNWGLAFSLAIKDGELTSVVLSKFLNSLDFHDVLYSHISLQYSQPFRISSINIDDVVSYWSHYVSLLLSSRDYSPSDTIKDVLAIADILQYKEKWCEYQICRIIVETILNPSCDKNLMIFTGNPAEQNFNDITRIDFTQLRMSEIYEHICQSINPNIFCPSLQEYKFIHAQLLYQSSNIEKAWEYVSIIARIIVSHPAINCSHGFLTQLKQMALRLFHLINISNVSNHRYPKWLVDLCTFLAHPLPLMIPNDDSSKPNITTKAEIKISQPARQEVSIAPATIKEENDRQNETFVKPDKVDESPNIVKPVQELPSHPQTVQKEVQPTSASLPSSIDHKYPTNVPSSSVPEEQNKSSENANAVLEDEEANPVPLVTVTQHIPVVFSSVPNLSTKETPNKNSVNIQTTKIPPNKPVYPSQSVTENNPPPPNRRQNVSSESEVAAALHTTPSNAQPTSESVENKGLLSGASNIFKKFFKPKEQAFLPDDKEPTIVFDNITKRYVDKSLKNNAAMNPSSTPPPKSIPILANSQSSYKPNMDPATRIKPARYIPPKY